MGMLIRKAAVIGSGTLDRGTTAPRAGAGSPVALCDVPAPNSTPTDPQPHLQTMSEAIARARVSQSAHQVRGRGVLSGAARSALNCTHLLGESRRAAPYLAAGGYTPQLPGKIGAAAHDALIANRSADAPCGGDRSEPGWVPDQIVPDRVREALAHMAHMLQHTTPLRN